MKDEITKQCEMAWKRGRAFGLLWGIIGTLLAALIIKIIF